MSLSDIFTLIGFIFNVLMGLWIILYVLFDYNYFD